MSMLLRRYHKKEEAEIEVKVEEVKPKKRAFKKKKTEEAGE